MRWRAGQRRAARQAERQQANADRQFREADHWADVAEAAPNYRREITAERAGRGTREELSTPYGMGYTEDRHMGWDEYFGGELDAAKASDGPVLPGGALDAEISRLALAFPDPGDFGPGADADAATVAAWEERAWAEGERDRARDRAELEERRAAEVDDPAESHRYRPAPRVTAREITTDASEHRVTWDQYLHAGLGGEQDADAHRQQRERVRAAGQGPADGSHPGGLFADAIAASDRRAAQQDREAARWVRGGREQQELRDARRLARWRRRIRRLR